MSLGKSACVVCGKPLEYFEEARPMKCTLCGKEEAGHCICEGDHYVCDTCHRMAGVNFIMEACRKSEVKNPVELAQWIMENGAIYPNGPEHHFLVGAVLLSAYKNAGGDVDLDVALVEMRSRSAQVPGGACGFWGCCGAAVSAGQFYSIISGSTPMTQDSWGKTARLTSNIIGKLADIGGPRCCKRTGFVALEEAVQYTADTTGIRMELPEQTVCTFMADNAECRKTECPFFPA